MLSVWSEKVAIMLLCLCGKWIQQLEQWEWCVVIWVKGVPSELFMTKPTQHEAQKRAGVITELMPRTDVPSPGTCCSVCLGRPQPWHVLLCVPGMLHGIRRALL